jgi:hypothetical protein
MDRMTIETDPFGTFAVMPSSEGMTSPLLGLVDWYHVDICEPSTGRPFAECCSCEGNREHGCICIHMLAVNRLFEKTDMSKANRQPASPPPAGPAPLEVETIEAQAVNVCWLLAAVVAMQIAAKDAPVQLPRKPARPDRPRPASRQPSQIGQSSLSERPRLLARKSQNERNGQPNPGQRHQPQTRGKYIPCSVSLPRS